MKVLIDLNVLLDVVQNRTAYYADSAQILSRARQAEFTACFPGHAITTLYYILRKEKGHPTAGRIVDWVLQHFGVGMTNKAVLQMARQLSFSDFEDGVVAATAQMESCDYVITRNTSDFAGSPVPAITPSDFLALPLTPRSK